MATRRRYLVKTIPKGEDRGWVNSLQNGRAYLPVRAAQPYTHVIVIHGDRALVMRVARRRGSRSTEWCGPAATEPVRATQRVYFDPKTVHIYPARVRGFQGIRYTHRAGRYAQGAP